MICQGQSSFGISEMFVNKLQVVKHLRQKHDRVILIYFLTCYDNPKYEVVKSDVNLVFNAKLLGLKLSLLFELLPDHSDLKNKSYFSKLQIELIKLVLRFCDVASESTK